MKRFVIVAALAVGFMGATSGLAQAQGCGGGMCAVPGTAGQQPANPAAPMQHGMSGMGMMGTAPGATGAGPGMMGAMGMCGCCRQMAMMQPGSPGGLQPMPHQGMGGDMGMGSPLTPPTGTPPAPEGTAPAQ